MNPPDGAILKAWGWQKQVYADDQREVWIGFGKADGCTSVHRHDRHLQELFVLNGAAETEKGDSDDTDGIVTPKMNHRLWFYLDTFFVEHYTKLHGAPPVTEDTIREAA